MHGDNVIETVIQHYSTQRNCLLVKNVFKMLQLCDIGPVCQ